MLRVLLGALLLLLCAYRTHERSQAWRSDEALWSSAVTSSPSLPRPALNLAVAFGRQTQWDKAIQWTAHAIALTKADPARYGWMHMYLCQQINRLEVLMADPPSFSLECAF